MISPQSHQMIGAWADAFPAYTLIVGYSSLGHFFLHDPASKDYAVLHPFKAAAKSYGGHASTAAFEQTILRDPGFEAYVLRSDHVRAIAEHVGPLDEEEVYIPQPYPTLGGSEAPETYGKGDVWVFAELVAQSIGL
ncbi:DUF1851 domain-containing protein [Xanthomonas maliensis]|nr:DUF1851 domain-containing protein [Xanthomonas maliensis]